MFDYDEMFTFETDDSLSASPIYARYHSVDGYHAVPPPYTGTFMLPKPDLVFHDVPNVNKPVHTAFNIKLSPTKPDKDLSHTLKPSTPIIKDWVSDSEDDSEAEIPQHAPSFLQPSKQVKTPRSFVKTVRTSIPAANHKEAIPKPKSNGTSKNRKACFVCKSLDNLIKDCDYYNWKVVPTPARNHAQRGNHHQYARMTLPNPKGILRQAKPVVTKPHLPPRWHINRSPSLKASTFPLKVTATKTLMVNVVKGNWVWKPKCPILDHGNPQHALKDKRFIDSGCSRHMTGNMSYLYDFEELNGGYVAFGGNPKVMCDKKNSVLFTDTECLVLSPEFKLPNESQVLLRVPKENNTYNVDLKNIVPSGDLTCLFKKATLDESNLWHRRLGHINFKTMNKLVKCNLVRDSLLPIPFWAEAVNTACYVQNRVLVTKPHNKTPYELLLGRTPSIDPLGKFDGKADEGFFVGYSVSSKAFRVFNSRTRIVQETLHINFLENKPNVAGSGPTWLFDIDTLIKTMNYQPVTAGNQSNPSVGDQEQFDAKKARDDNVQQYVLFTVWSSGFINPQNTNDDASFGGKEPEFEGMKPESKVYVSPSSTAQTKKHDDKTKKEAKGKSPVESLTRYRNLSAELEDFFDNSINEVNAADSPVPAIGQISTNITNTFSAASPSNAAVSPTHRKYSYVNTSQYPNDPNMLELEDITYSDDEEDVSAEADFTNLETTITISPIPTTRVHKDHHVTQIIGDLSSATQTRSMTRVAKDQCRLSQINNDDFHTCMFAYFLLQEEHKRVHQALKDPSWIEVMQEELLQFKMQKVWVLVDLPHGKRAIGHTQEEGIDYEEVFAPVARIEAIRLTDGKLASTPIDTEKSLLKDPDSEDVDVHTYRSMIVKRIFRYLKGKPHLGLWYPKDSPFNLVAYSDSDYAGASLDKKSTTRGCQFLGCRLISWQCKKQTVMDTSSTEAEHVAATSCYAQVLWIQNQLLDYGVVRNVDSFTKFYMYPQFLQLMIRAQEKGFSRVDTPLFKGMIMAQQDDDIVDEGAASVAVDDVSAAADEASIPSSTPTTLPPPPSQDLPSTSQKLERINKLKVSKLRRLKKVRTSQRVDTSDDTVMDDVSKQGRIVASMDADVDVTLKDVADIAKEVDDDAEIEESADVQGRQAESQAQIYQIDLEHADKVLSMQDDELEPTKLQEVVEVVTTAKLMTEVVTTTSATITTADTPIPDATITAAAPTLTTAPSAARRRKEVVIRDHEESATPSIIIHSEAKSKDKEKGILLEEPKPLKKQAQIEHDEAYARELEVKLNKNINWDDVIDQV
nr:hypothetical protein [Tanacetum cinerariifolium]